MNVISEPITKPATTQSRKVAARQLMTDPAAFFGDSLTRMHTLPRDEVQELQLTALAMRFEEQRERIPMLAKLADRQGIRKIDAFDEVLPLCFEHNAFKSYPGSLLAKGDFVKLTSWINKLTSHDVSGIDASRSETIDEWLDLLSEESELDPITSSGSTGTMSFIPRDRSDWTKAMRSYRVQTFQTFGTPPTEADLNEEIHVIYPTYSDGRASIFRHAHYFGKHIALGSAAHFHPLYRMKGSADLMYLAARMRLAASKGDASRVEVPPKLLARRDELEQMQKDMSVRQASFVEELVYQLEGKRVFCTCPWNLLYDVATKGLARGVQCKFAPNSVITSGGGAKGLVRPDDWESTILRFFGVPKLSMGYSMSEQLHFDRMCEHGRYHIQPWAIPFVLDPETSKPLPRKGTQKGRAAFFDVCLNGHWGGVISGDEIEIDWDTPCGCGRTSLHLGSRIQRFSEKQGGSDKITCAATPEAHAEAMDFLVSQ